MLSLCFPEGKDENRKGIVQMEIAEGVKLQLCYVLHHLLDLQKRHRVENIIAFAQDYVGDVRIKIHTFSLMYSSIMYLPFYASFSVKRIRHVDRSYILKKSNSLSDPARPAAALHRDQAVRPSFVCRGQEDARVPLSSSRADERYPRLQDAH